MHTTVQSEGQLRCWCRVLHTSPKQRAQHSLHITCATRPAHQVQRSTVLLQQLAAEWTLAPLVRTHEYIGGATPPPTLAPAACWKKGRASPLCITALLLLQPHTLLCTCAAKCDNKCANTGSVPATHQELVNPRSNQRSNPGAITAAVSGAEGATQALQNPPQDQSTASTSCHAGRRAGGAAG